MVSGWLERCWWWLWTSSCCSPESPPTTKLNRLAGLPVCVLFRPWTGSRPSRQGQNFGTSEIYSDEQRVFGGDGIAFALPTQLSRVWFSAFLKLHIWCCWDLSTVALLREKKHTSWSNPSSDYNSKLCAIKTPFWRKILLVKPITAAQPRLFCRLNSFFEYTDT